MSSHTSTKLKKKLNGQKKTNFFINLLNILKNHFIIILLTLGIIAGTVISYYYYIRHELESRIPDPFMNTDERIIQ